MLKDEYVLSNREGGFPEVPDKLRACFSLVVMAFCSVIKEMKLVSVGNEISPTKMHFSRHQKLN